ncbi:MAG TPA: hypothetical protein ENG59_08085 [Chloroflexi bacterium]|nr:MAG: hypothetical protein DRI46_00830 [Chloroflexota bacterium]HDD56183.1 hypothetical protein [Chloroflexota bacterium]
MSSFISRTRRNHGLEHATLNLLALSHPGKSFAGHSDGSGFWILGKISSQELTRTIEDALARLRAGQANLAIHKNCGTNLLVSGFAAGVAGTAGLIGVGHKTRDKIERIPLITLFSVAALLLSRPLGPLLQREVTVNADPGNLQIIGITRHSLNGTPAHRIRTQA